MSALITSPGINFSQNDKTSIRVYGKREYFEITEFLEINHVGIKPIVLNVKDIGVINLIKTPAILAKTISLAIVYLEEKTDLLSDELKEDLYNLVSSIMSNKDLIKGSVDVHIDQLSKVYDSLPVIKINPNKVCLKIPNHKNISINLSIIKTNFNNRYKVSLAVTNGKDTKNFLRNARVKNVNSLIKQLVDWEVLAKRDSATCIYLQVSEDIRNFLLRYKKTINILIDDINGVWNGKE